MCIILKPFNLYTEQIFREVEIMKRVTVGGVNINNLRYTDDTVLLTCNEKDLQNLVTAVNDKGKPYGMEMNVMKTKAMLITRLKQTSKIKMSIVILRITLEIGVSMAGAF